MEMTAEFINKRMIWIDDRCLIYLPATFEEFKSSPNVFEFRGIIFNKTRFRVLNIGMGGEAIYISNVCKPTVLDQESVFADEMCVSIATGEEYSIEDYERLLNLKPFL